MASETVPDRNASFGAGGDPTRRSSRRRAGPNFHAGEIPSTVGTYLARRMIDVGVKDYFVVPGDFNLILLDEILRFPELRLISCCNELNAGYAADGYARANGVGVIFTTFTVGSLSAINAIAGAYSADLPVVIIAGGPNTLDHGSNRVLHHTTGEENRSQELRCFEAVTAKAIEIRHPSNAAAQIDQAFSTAIREKKPVFISIACNISTAAVAMPIPFRINVMKTSNPESLALAVDAVAALWNKAVNPVMVVGCKVKPAQALADIISLSTASGAGTAIMPDAKGLFPETHPNYVGLWWGQVSSPNCAAVVDSADVQLFLGPRFNDYNTVGYTSLLKWNNMVIVGMDRVYTPKAEYGCVYMAEFLRALAKKLTPNETSLKTFQRLVAHDAKPQEYSFNAPKAMLTTRNIDHQVQSLLSDKTALLVETGDSWFHGQRMKLPEGCLYEFQMQYGSIGWSVGAVLGYAMALEGQKRVIAMIGDGSFQMTAQEVSTMIRYEQNPIIFLINNNGYTIEVEIHDGIYNNIQMWDYSGLISVFNGPFGSGNAKAWKCKTEQELIQAVSEAQANKGLSFIECFTDRDDCTKELLEWGTRVAMANGRQKNNF